MSFDVRSLFRKTVSDMDKTEEPNVQFRKSLKERLLEAQLISDNADESKSSILFDK